MNRSRLWATSRLAEPPESAKGREKLVAWLKLLENHAAKRDPAEPMASYDLSWIWRELDVADLRK